MGFQVYYLLLFFIFLLDGRLQQMQVIDAETGEAIPYVNIWIKGSRLGTSSDVDGRFQLDAQVTDTLIFSAVGYTKREIPYSKLNARVQLNPEASYLQEVIVSPKIENTFVVNPIASSKCRYLYGVRETKEPWMIGTRIFYQEEMLLGDKLRTLRFQTQSDMKGALMNIRLYALDSLGFPADFLIGQNLLVELKKGTHINEIDLTDFRIRFPEAGIAVVAEWYLLPRNRHEYKVTIEGEREKQIGVSYEPALCTRVSETGDRGIYFRDGVWKEAESFSGEFREFKVELTMSN